jgi:putative membrane protein
MAHTVSGFRLSDTYDFSGRGDRSIQHLPLAPHDQSQSAASATVKTQIFDQRRTNVERKPNTLRSTFLAPSLRGAFAGFVATGPMTLFMLAAHRYLPPGKRSSLPPRKLTMELAKRVGLKKHMSQPQRTGATWIAHFAYGATIGAVYGLLARKIPVAPLVKGTTFGLVVWVASYLVGVPALQMPEAAIDQPWHRNVLMVGAHGIWGAVAGEVVHFLDR